MNTCRRIGAALVTSLLSVSSGFAMAMPAPKSEPVNGFVHGENLEWSVQHAQSKQSSQSHRLFHKSAEEDRALWMKQNASMRGTPEYARAYRIFMQHRNLKHRQWHMEAVGQTKPETTQSNVLKIFYTQTSVTIVAPEGPSATSGRAFMGSRPSRRTIVLETRQQQKLHALTVGQR